MARIAGLLTEPGSGARDTVARMLSRFPGPNTAAHVEAGPAAMGASRPEHAPEALVVRGLMTVAFDGTVFNARELGAARQAPAALFADLHERFGFAGALERINGDFAVALFDAGTGTLWLARDRFGVKPLYYTHKGPAFAFASQPGALLAVPGVSDATDRRFVALFAASHYRTFDNDPDASPYADIAQLPAAHYLEVRRGASPRKARYWSLTDEPDLDESPGKLAERYRELLLDAVRMRFEAARAPGFTLSGGMDSSSVLASAVRASGAKQHAFSSVYEDRTYDESDEIRSMLDSAVEQWHAIKIATPDVFGVIDRMVRVHDEPVATATWLSHYLLCEETARRGFGSLFGGLGGDELNAGEYEYFFFHFADLRRAGEEERLRTEVEWWAHYHDHPIYRKNMAVVDEALGRIVNLDRAGVCLPDRQRIERYRDVLAPGFFDLAAYVPEMERPFSSYLKNRTYQDIFRETAPCCLRAEDRQSAAFGLDHFDPFFDHRLVELMFRVPGNLKIRDGVTKILLREATRGLLPEETRTRVKKTGWNAPAHVWFSGQGLEFVRDLVGSRAFRQRGIYDVARVSSVIDEHEQIVQTGATQENHMMFLWQLVNLELWLRSLDGGKQGNQ
jgi:asparagine synthase (glutamine-hydrolysing)